MTKRKPEEVVQKAIVSYLRHVLPNAIIHHSPNEGNRGGKRGKLDGARNKAMGQLAGFPDILIFADGRGYCIEVKAEGGRLSQVQRLVRDELERQGVPYAVCRSIDDVRAILVEWAIRTAEIAE